MTQRSRTTLKGYFNTGDIPTETNFADTVDSVLNLTDDTLDNVPDGTTYKLYSATEKSKLAAVEAFADVTDAVNVGSSIHGSTPKTTMADADKMAIIDTEASNVLKTLSWAYVKSILKTYFDGLYTFLNLADYPVEPSSDDSYVGPHTNDIVAGETIAQWDLVYLKSDGKWWKTDADAVATAGNVLVAMATEGKNADEAMNVVLPGSVIRNDGWVDWTVASPLYIDTTTAGGMTQTQPSGTDDVIRIVGFALTVDCIFFNPSNDHITHT
jgi:hypothetical protein